MILERAGDYRQARAEAGTLSLSRRQQTLTALSLIFAVFRPIPAGVVLEEVDARSTPNVDGSAR